MPDKATTSAEPVMIAWLSGAESDIQALAAGGASLRHFGLTSPSMARATALRISREHGGIAIVEASCPAFTAVCQILGRSPSIRLVTVHPTTRCMDSITIPPAICYA
jgi:hypothetical protein